METTSTGIRKDGTMKDGLWNKVIEVLFDDSNRRRDHKLEYKVDKGTSNKQLLQSMLKTIEEGGGGNFTFELQWEGGKERLVCPDDTIDRHFWFTKDEEDDSLIMHVSWIRKKRKFTEEDAYLLLLSLGGGGF
jgi:hypothetical protein